MQRNVHLLQKNEWQRFYSFNQRHRTFSSLSHSTLKTLNLTTKNISHDNI